MQQRVSQGVDLGVGMCKYLLLAPHSHDFSFLERLQEATLVAIAKIQARISFLGQHLQWRLRLLCPMDHAPFHMGIA